MTERITFQESVGSDDDRRPKTLRARLGPVGYTVTLATIILAFLALGVGLSIVVHASPASDRTADTRRGSSSDQSSNCSNALGKKRGATAGTPSGAARSREVLRATGARVIPRIETIQAESL